MTSRQDEIFNAILRERQYQDGKWGVPEYRNHSVPAWLIIIRKELEEAEDAWMDNGDSEPALIEILQVAAVAVACLELHGVYEREELGSA